jgi:putative ABC transport system ATP-binding protein
LSPVPSPPAPLIQLERLSRTYREGGVERPVLCGVTASIGAGELAVILGRSGSGKSTLLNLIAGIDLPSSGRVVVDGEDLGALSERQRTLFRRDRLGFVFQFFNLIPTLTVEENLLLPLELAGKVAAADRERALALLDRVGLGDRRPSFPDRLSGGEQQRVAVARALAHDPPLVLADEPTGNLDLETGIEVLELLDSLVRTRGKTLVMVTHAREVMGLADRVFTLAEGHLREIETDEAAAGSP